MVTSQLRIIVTGLVGLYPVGGVAWDYLQYAIGLARLGHDVYYHEDTWSWPYHPLEKQYTSKNIYSAKFIRDFFERFAPELCERWHYLHLHEKSFGMTKTKFDAVSATADLYINVSGSSFIPESLSPRCVKVFLDTDPGYNQIVFSERFPWSENVDRWCVSLAEHDQHFTYAENIHGVDCTIPKIGFKWKTTRMPIVMDLWELDASTKPSVKHNWTTVMTWNSFKGKLIYRDVEYKSKGSEFEKLIELPQYVQVPLKIAVGGMNAPLKLLAKHGWHVVDGPSTTLMPGQYREFIAASCGEVSASKHVYAAMRSGWFSCRSACYLASGRPVVVQDTGFSSVLPTGEGILTFKTIEEAASSIQEVEINYDKHAKASRDIAEEYFDSEKVLTQMVDTAVSS